jgi:hypothetical protein
MIGHASAYVDVKQAFAAATEAGENGVGPAVHASDPASGLLVMENLVDTASTATLNVFDDDARLEQLIALRKRVHEFGSITRSATVFDDVRTLTDLATANSDSDIGNTMAWFRIGMARTGFAAVILPAVKLPNFIQLARDHSPMSETVTSSPLGRRCAIAPFILCTRTSCSTRTLAGSSSVIDAIELATSG